ncbi:MAG: hypothetical protein PVJ76_07925 [Gemmatimonadota bacterium]|jgi:hypothetical protein
MTEHLSPSEEMSLRDGVEEGAATCPRCGSTLIVTAVPHRSDVAYVRNRVFLSCADCPFKAVVDRK